MRRMTTEQRSTHASLRGALLGLSAAALFGLSPPVHKLLLGAVEPLLLAGLSYLGAAGGLWLHRLVSPPSREPGLGRSDLAALTGVVLAGGVAGPVLMLFGLTRVSGLTGSLLLNLEAPFTMLLAVLVFREHLGRGASWAAALIVVGAVLLELEPGSIRADTAGVLLLAAACACWALDNNLTQRLSLRDPFAIVRIKTLAAGAVNTALAVVVARSPWPEPRYVAGALALGCLSYGLSIVLDAYALRLVGAAREAAYFATAPFIGVVGSLLLLGESIGSVQALAMLAMTIGVVLLIRERHSHVHEHGPLEHEHLHVHDEHHQHAHGEAVVPGEPHAHRHFHVSLVHDHPHVPDAHHRHRH
jgi:drug/metabolite transporter (DMT)-like permease